MGLSKVVSGMEDIVNQLVHDAPRVEGTDELKTAALMAQITQIIDNTTDTKSLSELKSSIRLLQKSTQTNRIFQLFHRFFSPVDVQQEQKCQRVFAEFFQSINKQEMVLLENGIRLHISGDLNFREWYREYRILLIDKVLKNDACPKELVLAIAANFALGYETLPLDCFPKYALSYMDIIYNWSIPLEKKVQKIRALLHEDAVIGIAHLTMAGVRWNELSTIQGIDLEQLAPYIRVFNCDNNSTLRSLPAMPKCLRFRCVHSALQSLPMLNSCREVLCVGCAALEEIIGLPACTEINCHSCSNLLRISVSCATRIMVLCANCPQLTTIETIEESGSVAVLRLESFYARSLEVDVDVLSEDPEKFLQELSSDIDMGIPKISFVSKGQRSIVIDAGGPKRVFVTHLIYNLFLGSGKTLPHKRTYDGDKMGVLPSSSRDVHSKSYEILGKLFAMCYLGENGFTTGSVFDPRLFQMLTQLGIAEGDEWVRFRVAAVFYEWPVEEVENWVRGTGKISRETWERLQYILETKDENAQREEFKELLIADDTVNAVISIATGMKAYLGKLKWKMVQNTDPAVLRVKIEGELTIESVIDNLEWIQGAVSESNFKRTQQWLLEWIRNADKEKLESFVEAISGNTTVSRVKPLKISLFNRGAHYLPYLSTCDGDLSLSCEYPDQKTFNEKLEFSIAESLAKGENSIMGFQER